MSQTLERVDIDGWFDRTSGLLVFIKPAVTNAVPKSYVGLYSAAQQAINGVIISGLLAVGDDGNLYRPDGTVFTGAGVSRFADLTDKITADLVGTNTGLAAALVAKAAKTGQQFEKQLFIAAPIDGLILALQAEVGCTITRVTAKLVSGTTTLTPAINGAALAALNVSSTKGHNDYAAANVVTAGDETTLTLSASATPVGLSVTLLQSRSLA